MATGQSVNTPPDARAGWASPLQRGRRRPAIRWIAHGVLFVALAAGIFGLLPRLGGLSVIEVTLAAITVGFGAPRRPRYWPCSAYRIVSYGSRCYQRRRLSPAKVTARRTRTKSLDTAVHLIVSPRIPRIHFLPKRAVSPGRRNMSSTAARWPIATLKPIAR